MTNATSYPECEACGRPILPPDEPVGFADQENVSSFNAAGSSEYTDGRIHLYHEAHAPETRVGVRRRLRGV